MPAARTVTISFLGSTQQLEASLRRAGLVAEESGSKIGGAFTAGTDKAGGAISKLGQTAGNWGVPFAASLQTVGKHLDDTTSKTQKLHASLSEAGKVTLLAGGAGLAAVAGEAVKLGQAYQTAGASIQGATGQSAKSVGQLKSAFDTLGTGSQAAVGSGMAMEAAYATVAGQLKLTEGHALSAAEATKFATAANNLAESGAANLAEAYSATAKVMQTFHLDASHAAEVTDTLYSTSKAVNVPVEQIAAAMGKLHAGLGAVAPSMRDVSGFMVALGKEGLTGGRGVQVVGSAMQTLLGSSKPVHETLKNLGVTLTDSSGKFIGMQAAIERLQPALAKLPPDQRRFAEQQILGKGATEKLGQVIMAGVPAWQAASNAANRHTSAQKAAEAQSKTFHDEMERLKHTVETLGGDLGVILIPKIQAVATALSDGIKWLEKHKAAAKALAIVITGVLGAAVSVFAYDQSKKFIDGTKRMAEGLGGVGKKILETTGVIQTQSAEQSAAVEANAAKIQASNTATDASFAELGPAAASGTAAVDGAVAGEAGAVAAADSAIEADNVAAGASFTALLGPIAAAVAAVVAAQPLIEKVTGGNLGETPTEGAEAHGAPGKHTQGEFPGGALNRLMVSGKGVSEQAASKAILESIGAPTGGSPLAAMEAWIKQEGGHFKNQAKYNPLNTTLAMPGAGNTGSQGNIKVYQNWQQGIEATAKTLGGGAYSSIVKDFKSGASPKAIEEAINKSPWGTHFSSYTGGRGTGPESSSKTIGHETHPNAALQLRMEEASGAKPKKARAGAKAKAEPYVQPLEDAKQTSIDDGVDYLTKVGTAVKAIGAGVISKIIPNWYQGQPLVEEQLTQGSRKGQDVYYAEGIAPGVREGQHVTAGQTIARTTSQPTGLEFGLGAAGGLTLAQASHERQGEVGKRGTRAGVEYEHFIASIGKGGTVLSQVAKAAEGAEKAEATRLTALNTAAKKMLGETIPRGNLEQAIQSGGVPQLEKILGVSTGGKAGTTLSKVLGGYGGRELSQRSLEGTVMPTLAKDAQGTPTGKAFDSMIQQLKAAHMDALVGDLVQAHKQALADLGRELYAVTQEREAQKVTNQATEEKVRTTQTANLASKQLQIADDQSKQITDAMSASATQIGDATQVIKDSFAQMVEAVNLATQKMADAASGEVTKTQDTTAIAVATLAERGKYGLDLIAQKLEVQLDQMKASYDIEIQTAKIAVDQAKISGQQLIAGKQMGLDVLKAHEDALVASAKAHTDAATITAHQEEMTAQGMLDAATVSAQARDDATYLATVLVAGGTKAQQQAAEGMVKWATSAGIAQMTKAEAHLSDVNSKAEGAIHAAERAVAAAEGQSAEAIANAARGLAEAEGSANAAIANAQQGLTSIEDTAHIAEAALEGKIAIKREEAQVQYAGSGLVINQYGMNPSDAAANASELGWVLRHQLPVG
jgi:TP901 family phage tail tape measure protein